MANTEIWIASLLLKLFLSANDTPPYLHTTYTLNRELISAGDVSVFCRRMNPDDHLFGCLLAQWEHSD